MKKLSSALCGAALLTAALAAPALAAPAHVVVHGAYPIYPPTSYYDSYGADLAGDGFYGDPLSQYYDPAGAVPDTRYYGPPAVDLVLARTLDRTGDSMLGHILKCQAHYATYSAASNTYFGRNGIPVACYL